MKKVLFSMAALLAFVAWVACCRSEAVAKAPSSEVSVTISTPESKLAIPILARVGSRFVIAIPSNRTTGFRWRIANKPGPQVKFVGSAYAAPQGNLVGEGGTESWTFRAAGKGTTKIVMEYARPGAKAKPIKKQVFWVRVIA